MQRAFVISDIHLGASTSLLTAIDYDAEKNQLFERPLAAAVLDKLLTDLKERLFGEKIQQCILLGDIFDFSFASYGLAMRNGRWFFQKLVEADLFEEFVYLPGNHDHHLWHQICEHYYLISELENPPLDYPQTLPASLLLQRTFLDRLMPEGHSLQVTYPNYEMKVNGKMFFLHHGHFLQKLYIAASQFLAESIQTNSIEDLEMLNAPFLEFGWYSIGQAYNTGQNKLLDRLYFMFKNQNTQGLDRLLKLFLQKIDRWEPRRKRRRWNVFGLITDNLIKWIGPFLIKRLFFKQTRLFSKAQHASSARHKRLTPSMQNAITEYVEKYLVSDIGECRHCNFIFGHTHEPENIEIHHEPHQRTYHIYNTGGWIVDSLDEDNELVIPKTAPLLIYKDGTVQPLLFAGKHAAFLKSQLAHDPVFQKIKQDQILR